MKFILVATSLFLALALPMVPAQPVCGAIDNGALADPPAVDALEEQLRNDPAIMALILALKDDPAMQSLLADPAVVRALQTGDLEMLVNDPRFQKLLADPVVKDIEQKLR